MDTPDSPPVEIVPISRLFCSPVQAAGELPDDDLRLYAVLADVELHALAALRKGRDVAELIALLDKLQWRDGEKQKEALKRVCAMAKEGQVSQSARRIPFDIEGSRVFLSLQERFRRAGCITCRHHFSHFT